MMAKMSRVVWFAFAAVFAVSVVFSGFSAQAMLAQTATYPSNPTVEDLLHRMDAMQRELDYLREQNARAQYPDSFSEGQVRLASLSASGCELVCHGNRCCQKCAGGCCCGQCPTPCIDCPRVSTLNPYFNVNIFGEFKLDMLLSDARAVSRREPDFRNAIVPDNDGMFYHTPFAWKF